MYLQKMPPGVFHFRKAMPRDLTGAGYPCHIKISLLTKDQSLAINRNLDIVKVTHELCVTNKTSYPTFKSQLDSKVDTFRGDYVSSGLMGVTVAEGGQVHAVHTKFCSMRMCWIFLSMTSHSRTLFPDGDATIASDLPIYDILPKPGSTILTLCDLIIEATSLGRIMGKPKGKIANWKRYNLALALCDS
ncbi:hypothetical protein NF212_07055 [Parasalinivibrio latis]|uniref:hypothetical protein n=1 Tax=Parasalinivibrio latis TaxID=2952610 RepID=UPI0030E38618